MNRFQKFLQDTILKAIHIPRATPWQIWSQPGSRVDYVSQVDSQRSSIVMAVINWIARTFPEAPPMLWQQDDDGVWVPVPQHPMISLLRRPTPFYSGNNLWMATILSWVLDGNAYWQKVRAPGGVVQLWYVPHWLIAPKWPLGSNDVFISHYEYLPGATPTRIELEDVVHFRYGLDPENTRIGLSPLKSLMRELATDDEAANFTASILRNFGVPGLVISPDGEMVAPPSPDEVLEAKAAYQQKFTGDHRGEPLVMKGPTKVQQFGFSPEQMNTRALRQIPEERVTAVLGIPAAVVGLGTGLEQTKVGATMRELRELAYENNIIPTQRLFSEEVSTQLLPDFVTDLEGWMFGFDLKDVRVLQDDENARAERWVKLVQGGVATRAEAREAEGLTVEDSDNVYLQPVSTVEVPAGERTTTTPTKSLFTLPELKATREQSVLMRQFRRDHARLEGLFAADLVKRFDELGDIAHAAAVRHVKAFERALVTAGTNGHSVKADPTPDDIEATRRIIEDMRSGRWAQDSLLPAFEGHYLRTAAQTVASIKAVMDVGVDLPDPAQRRIVAQGGTRMGLLDVEADTRKAIFRSLLEGRSQGEGPAALARRIRENVPAGRFGEAGVQYRSTMIARTETKFAQNVASIEAYQASDTFDGVVAFDNQTGFGDEDCTARDGKVFSYSDAGGETAAEHPNGTLSWAPNIRS